MRRGDSGPEVHQLKTVLRLAGVNLSATDKFDLATEAAVRCIQELNGLDKDGIVGPLTLRELKSKDFAVKKDPIKWVQIVPYFSQRDNEFKPSGTCNVTSLAMVLSHLGERPTPEHQLEDELFLQLQTKEAQEEFSRSYPDLKKRGYSARHIHGMLGWLARKRGYKWAYSESASMYSINSIRQPLITSGAFTGSGHIICIVGVTAVNDLIVHDPWGNWDRGYNSKENGKYRIYNREDMQTVLSGQDAQHKRIHLISKS